MHADRRDNLVLLCVDHADIVRSRVDDIDFISLWICGYPRRLGANREIAHWPESAQVNHRDRVALPIGNVSVLAIERSPRWQSAFMEIPPSAGGDERKHDGK